jgi:glycerophosphoryl diester phosphodiesterase
MGTEKFLDTLMLRPNLQREAIMRQRILSGLVIVIVVIAVIYFGLVALSQPMPDKPFFVDNSIRVFAHQGGDGLRPSNTMSAFQNAVDLGADVLEMDIHSTSDGVIVVIHDDSVDRTTDGTGLVNDFTFAELQQLDAGYDWPTLEEESARTDRPFRGQGIVIPSLQEVFQAFPNMPMNIEIKQQEPSIAMPLCIMLRQYNLTDQVLIASFHPESIHEFRQACPEVPTAAVEGEVRQFYIFNTIGMSAIYQPVAYAFQVPEYAGDLHVVTQSFVQNAQGLNIDIHPWTINDPEQIQRMIDLGVNGIITDYPDRVLQLLGR